MTETSMELFCYQAECGDAIRVRYIGEDDSPHNIFLDSGFERTYHRVLREEINTLIRRGEYIDLWVISHIHDDHIGGAIKYINEDIKDISKAWFYNPPRIYPVTSGEKVNVISSPASIVQGDKLYSYLYYRNKLPNQDITVDLGIQDLFGMKTHILSPTPSILTALRRKYQLGIPFEKNEIDEISHATSAMGYDYHKKLEDFDLDEFNEDGSLENKSSISLLLEYQGKKVLWLADSHPSVIQNTLSEKGYSVNSPLVCDYVFVSHHASKGNNSTQLFSLIRCNNYIINSNGENKHRLPAKEALSRIIRNKYRTLDERYCLYFTYNTDRLQEIFLSDHENLYNRWNFDICYPTQKYIHIQV